MSETRAKARALRDAVNVGATSLEELTGDDDDDGGGGGGGSRQGSSSQGGSQQGVQGNGSSDKSRSDRSQAKATASQIEFLKALAAEWRGDQGVARLESRIGKSLEELSREEADSWVERLTPKESAEAAEGAGA